MEEEENALHVSSIWGGTFRMILRFDWTINVEIGSDLLAFGTPFLP